eukprot:6203103-Amphidinium_carterae.1
MSRMPQSTKWRQKVWLQNGPQLMAQIFTQCDKIASTTTLACSWLFNTPDASRRQEGQLPPAAEAQT